MSEIAVIFDMDGVMLDTQPLLHDALAAAGRVFGFDLTRELCLTLIGLNERDSVASIEKQLGISIAADDFLANFREHFETLLKDGIPMKPGLPELLSFLEEKGVSKAVATSSSREQTHKKLGHHKLLTRFSVVVTADEVSRGKPHPEIFLTAAEHLGIAPEKAYVLEDSEAGIMAAAEGGMIPIMIPDLKAPCAEVARQTHLICPSLFAVKSHFELVLR